MGPYPVNAKALLDMCFALKSALSIWPVFIFAWSRKYNLGNARTRGILSKINTLVRYVGQSFVPLLHPRWFLLVMKLL